MNEAQRTPMFLGKVEGDKDGEEAQNETIRAETKKWRSFQKEK